MSDPIPFTVAPLGPHQRAPLSDELVTVTLRGDEWAKITAALTIFGRKPDFPDYEKLRQAVYDQVVAIPERTDVAND